LEPKFQGEGVIPCHYIDCIKVYCRSYCVGIEAVALPVAVAYAGFCNGRGQDGPWAVLLRPGRPKEGVEFLERGQLALSHQLYDLWDRYKLLQRGPGRSPGRQAILPIF